jgi:hypothetical protein
MKDKDPQGQMNLQLPKHFISLAGHQTQVSQAGEV